MKGALEKRSTMWFVRSNQKPQTLTVGVVAGCALVLLIHTDSVRADDGLTNRLLCLTEDRRKSVNLADGLIEVAPVVFPERPDLLGTSDHFGWLLATMDGETLVVVTSDGGMWANNNDGMHPGAAVIDVERGVQHIFVYAGRPAAPAVSSG
jgi:hypothetical protein